MVRCGNKAKLWNTILNFLRRTSRSSFLSILDKSSPLISILPSVGSINRLINRMSVDFPLPESPIITNISPSRTENDARLTPTVLPVFFNISSFVNPSSKYFKACFEFLPKTFERLFISINGTHFTSLFIFLLNESAIHSNVVRMHLIYTNLSLNYPLYFMLPNNHIALKHL